MNGRLNLSTAFDGQKNVTEDLYFAPPFKVYSPFYDQKGWAKYISMCGSAGVLAGDENEIKLFVGENCKVIFTDQGYQKLFNTNGGVSKQSIKLVVRKNARLCYMPHPIMTFTGCEHISMGKVNITESSELIFSEIYCCGRTAMGEEFGLKRFRSRTEIAIDGRADFIDNTHCPYGKKAFSRASPTRDLCISTHLTRQCWKTFTKPTTQATLTAHSFAPPTRNVA